MICKCKKKMQVKDSRTLGGYRIRYHSCSCGHKTRSVEVEIPEDFARFKGDWLREAMKEKFVVKDYEVEIEKLKTELENSRMAFRRLLDEIRA